MDVCFYKMTFPLLFWILFIILNSVEAIYKMRTYNVEDLCKGDNKASLNIPEWGALLLKLNSSSHHRKFDCEIKLITYEGFWLAATIEEMKMRGRRDYNNRWNCQDHIKFVSPPTNFIGKVTGLGIFNKGASEELCGIKYLNSTNVKRARITQTSTDANSFLSDSKRLIMKFEQGEDNGQNSFTIVITSILRNSNDEVHAAACEGRHKCLKSNLYCINEELVCDGHVNCAISGSGTDEIDCDIDSQEPSFFNVTTIIVTVLCCVVLILGCFVCLCLNISHRKKYGRHRRPAPAVRHQVATSPSATAPYLQETGNSTPAYDVIILDDSSPKPRRHSLENDHPPQYDALFPNGPPLDDVNQNNS